jgi:hypothetical protein
MQLANFLVIHLKINTLQKIKLSGHGWPPQKGAVYVILEEMKSIRKFSMQNLFKCHRR